VVSKIAEAFRIALVVMLFAAPLWAQERRAVVAGTIGGAGLGHADSEQGSALMFGGAVGFHVTPRLVVEGDVHAARVSHVFGRDHHNCTEITFTGSLLFGPPRAAAHISSPAPARDCSGRTPMPSPRGFGSTGPTRSGSYTGGSEQRGTSRIA
jgi:hypothetical protein